MKITLFFAWLNWFCAALNISLYFFDSHWPVSLVVGTINLLVGLFCYYVYTQTKPYTY